MFLLSVPVGQISSPALTVTLSPSTVCALIFFLSVRFVSELLLKMRTADVLRLLEAGEIPAYKVGRNWKVPVSVLEEYVRRRSFEKVQNTEI